MNCQFCYEDISKSRRFSVDGNIVCERCFAEATALKEDVVNHPKHYTSHPSGVECKDISKHFDSPRGQAIQYIWRCEDKGHPITDLKKAIFWLNEKIKMYEDAGHTK